MGNVYEGQKETCHIIDSNTCGSFSPMPVGEMGKSAFALL